MSKRMTVIFEDEELYMALKIEAVRRGLPAKDIVSEAVREWLETQEDLELGPQIEAARAEPALYRSARRRKTTMPHVNPTEDEIKALLASARTIVVVGASSNPDRPSHGVLRRLQAVGYRVIPVNPNETEVLGERAFASLSEIHEPIDIVDVFRRAEYTPLVADEAVAVGAKTLWLQQGIWNEDAAARAKAGGLTVVMDLCLATTHTILQVPRKTAAA